MVGVERDLEDQDDCESGEDDRVRKQPPVEIDGRQEHERDGEDRADKRVDAQAETSEAARG